jgi:NADPH-dependent curcumin reductase CurA
LPDPADGEVLVRGIYLSLDPYMRGRISGQRSYARPVEVGAVMEGRVVGEIARSRDAGFREGDYVLGGFGWQLYSAIPGQGLLKLDPGEAPLDKKAAPADRIGLGRYRLLNWSGPIPATTYGRLTLAVAKEPLLRMEIVKRSDDIGGFVILPRR